MTKPTRRRPGVVLCIAAIALLAGSAWADDSAPMPHSGSSTPPTTAPGPKSPTKVDGTKDPAPANPEQDDDDSMDLRPELVEGRVSRFEVWTRRDQNTVVVVDGKAHQENTSFDVRGEVTWKIDKVAPDGSATCTMTLDWLDAKITRPDGSVAECDSRRAAGQDEDVQKLLRSMGGVPVKIGVAADGTVTSAAGVDAVRKKAGPGVTVPDELDFMETASDLALLPAAPQDAKPKTFWNAPSLWNHELGKLRYDTRWTVDGIEEIAEIPVATVSADAKVKLEPDLSKLPPGSPRIDIKLLSGQFKGQVMFDLSRGEAVGRNSVLSTRIEARIHAPNQVIVRTLTETVQSQTLRISENP